MLRSIRRRATQTDEPSINLTPLIDVVFVILIMFMVVAPLLEREEIELVSGPAGSAKSSIVQEPSPIAIYVRADNSIWYNQQQVTYRQLAERLTQAKRHYPRAIPQLFHDKKAQFGTYQEVKNRVESAGFDHMDLILNPG